MTRGLCAATHPHSSPQPAAGHTGTAPSTALRAGCAPPAAPASRLHPRQRAPAPATPARRPGPTGEGHRAAGVALASPNFPSHLPPPAAPGRLSHSSPRTPLIGTACSPTRSLLLSMLHPATHLCLHLLQSLSLLPTLFQPKSPFSERQPQFPEVEAPASPRGQPHSLLGRTSFLQLEGLGRWDLGAIGLLRCEGQV